MPLLMMCGMPCSGKSRRVEEFLEYVTRHNPQLVYHVVGGDDDCQPGYRSHVYSNPRQELDARGHLRSEVQRLLSKDVLVILDSLNYIKGFRYELYCISKSSRTPHAVIQLETNIEVAREWNSQRDPSSSYPQDVFEALVTRFEAPDSRNRWDSPLFSIRADCDLACEDVYNALMHSKPPPPNMSTQKQGVGMASTMQGVSEVSQAIINHILQVQQAAAGGAGDIAIPQATEKLRLTRPLTMPELRRLRQRFITYSKSRPLTNHSQDSNYMGTLFVRFLNNSC